MKKKILVVHNYYQIPGGEDTVVKNETELLKENGHEVLLYSRHNDELKNLSKLGKIKLFFETIFSIKTYKEVRVIIEKEKIEVLHVHNTLPLISPSVYYAALSKKIPVVQTVHNFRLLCPGATFVRNEEICEDCVENGLMCAIKNKCYRNSLAQTLTVTLMMVTHRVFGIYNKINYIALTEFNKKKLKSLVKNKNKIFVKPNFINNSRKINSFKNRKNQFVFAGRLDKLKGIDILLKAWKQIELTKTTNTPNLIICGTGPEEKWCKEYIKKQNLKHVHMLGFVKNLKVIDIINESKGMILPTQWYEGFPMTIVESMACGTPVIASDIGNTGNIIKDGINGLKFQFNSVEDLKEKIDSLLNLHISTYEYYRNNFDPKDNYRQLIKIYQNINI